MKRCLIILFLLTWTLFASAQEVSKVMDSWHNAAAETNFDKYFSLMDTESVFIGTDATERWNKQDFMKYAKPHFDNGKAWNFKVLERHINYSSDGKTAWLDELLNTQMKICRGSGVLVLKDGKWLIKQYVLSMTIPNEVSGAVIKEKSEIEDKLIQLIQKK